MTFRDRSKDSPMVPFAPGTRVRVRYLLGGSDLGTVVRAHLEPPGPLFRPNTPACYDVRMDYNGEVDDRIAASQVLPAEAS